jgi:hypothetical protein
LVVRSTVACVAILILAGAVVFSWQRSQIAHLRAQVARQGDVLNELSARVGHEGPLPDGSTRLPKAVHAGFARSADEGVAEARSDERRVILDEYRDVLSQMNLPPETAARLQDLLADRVETVLDAQDAAVRVGFAAGSSQMARAVSLAIAQVDRDIVGLVGQDGMRRIDGYPAGQGTEVAVTPQAPAPVVVTVVVQTPPAPVAAYADSGASPAPDAAAQYVSYPYPYLPYYPVAAVLNEPRGRRAFPGPRNGGERFFRNTAIFAVR